MLSPKVYCIQKMKEKHPWEKLARASLTLRAAKTGLAILEMFYLQKHFLENIWRRNVDQKSNNNSPSNILLTFALFPSYFQKY